MFSIAPLINRMLHTLHNCSRLAVTTKVTLDQLLGGILWQAALLSINEPYRKAAVDLWNRTTKDAQKRLPKEKTSGSKSRKVR